MGVPYYLVSVCGAGAHLAWQLRTVNYSSRRSCMAKFVSNKWLGALVFAGIVVDRALGSGSGSGSDSSEHSGSGSDISSRARFGPKAGELERPPTAAAIGAKDRR